MAGYQGKLTNWDDDVIDSKIQDAISGMWGEVQGEITAWDPIRQKGNIKPLYKPTYNGNELDMPELQDVPIRFPRAGNGAITHPVQIGDKVTLRPGMQSTENYHVDGTQTASDRRRFNLSDMEAHLAGGESLSDPIPNFDAENMHIRFDPEGKYGVRGSKDGKIKIEGSEGNIYQLLATVVELLSRDTLTITHGSSSGSGHRLEFQGQYAEIAAKLRAMAL